MNLNYNKYSDGLVPAVIQDAGSSVVLMLGFMNEDAIELTQTSGRVTFYSRSKRRLWTKGETSGNYLELVSMSADCDQDSILIKALPKGPICHTGAATCFNEPNGSGTDPTDFLLQLESVIDDRRSEKPENSYVARLFEKGINKIAQKVGEEAVELVIEAKDDDRERFTSEAADLLFHYLVLLRAKDISIRDVLSTLESRRG